MKNLKDAMDFRFACKQFDTNKKISDENFELILEAGRLSPSSYGLEHTHFLVIQNEKLKETLSPAIFNQPQIKSCSHLVVMLSKKPEFFTKGSEYLDKAFLRTTNGDKEKADKIRDNFLNFSKTVLKPDLTNWSKMQSFLAGANMMSMAASLSIDSCPIEGFSYENLYELLSTNVTSLEISNYNIAFCIAFGYRAGEAKPKTRWPLSELTTFVK